MGNDNKDIIKSTSNKPIIEEDESENPIDKIYDKMIDEYIEKEGLENYRHLNPLVPPNLLHAKLKEEIKAENEPIELSEYLKIAMKLLMNDENYNIEIKEYEDMRQQFSEAFENLNKINYEKPMEENFRKLLQINDATMETVLKIAQYEYNDKKLYESLSIFALLTLLEPEDPDYWYRLGIVAQQTERLELALRAFSNVISLNPDHLVARIFTIECYLKLGKFKEAKTELDELKKRPGISAMDSNGKKMIDQFNTILID